MAALRVIVGVLIVVVIGLAATLYVVASNLGNDAQGAQNEAARATAALRKMQTSPSKPQVTANDIDGLRTSVGQLQTDVTDIQTKLGVTSKQAKAVNDCLPEVQSEIDSLGWNNNGGYIQIGQQVSRPCQKVVYGGTLGG